MKKQGVIIVVFIILIVLGGLAYWQSGQKPVVNNENNNQNTTNQNTNIDNSNGQNTEEVDMGDWLIYTNDEYRFSFRYPKDWTIYNQSDKYVSFNYSQTYLSTELTLFVFQNPNKESIHDFYNNIDENKKIAGNDSLMYNWYASTEDYGSQKNIVVDGIEAVNFVSPMGIMENTTVSIPKDSLIVEIQIRGVEEILKDSEYEAILNSFEFTN
ncbi:MAG: PsbP-related protein [Patescibacteria group bacterium]